MWSEWTECIGSCRSSRRRVCSEQFGCEGFELQEKDCMNAADSCFKSISDNLPESETFSIRLNRFYYNLLRPYILFNA